MTTELYETPGDNVCALDGQLDQTCSAQCRDLDRKDYTHLLWTTLAEFPGILLTILSIERLGRKKTMALEFILLTIALCFLFDCTTNRTMLTIILFFIRGLASGVFQVSFNPNPKYVLYVMHWFLGCLCLHSRSLSNSSEVNRGRNLLRNGSFRSYIDSIHCSSLNEKLVSTCRGRVCLCGLIGRLFLSATTLWNARLRDVWSSRKNKCQPLLNDAIHHF